MTKTRSKKEGLNFSWLAALIVISIVFYSSVCKGDYFIFEDNFDDGVIAPEWSTYYSTTGYFAETDSTMQITADGTDMWSPYDEYGAVYTSVGGDFNVVVKVTSQTNTHEWAKSGISVKNDMTQPGSSLGYVFMLVTPVRYSFQWDEEAGSAVDDLTNNPNYPDYPDGWENIESFKGPVDWMENYGQRISGFIQPPTTGQYIFWIASDDNSELWLSTDNDPSHKVMIAMVPVWTPPEEWEWYTQQKSAEIYLVEGQLYYIEALHKDSGGGDNLAVAWQLIDGFNRKVISGNFLREWWTTGWMEDGFLDRYTQTDFNTSVYPSWLRLEKCGITFTGYYSITGQSGPWISVGSATAHGTNVVQDVGMAVTSHSYDVLGTVEFDDFILYEILKTPCARFGS